MGIFEIRGLLLLFAFLALLSCSFAEGMSESDFFVYLSPVSAQEKPTPDYVYFNVDVEKNKDIIASYIQWDAYVNPNNCSAPPPLPSNKVQPNNSSDDDGPEPHFWIQFVPPEHAGETDYSDNYFECTDTVGADTCTKNFSVGNNEGVWQVRFGAGVIVVSCNTVTGAYEWTWGLRNWTISVDGSSGGRVWKNEWRLITRNPPFTRDFYVLAKSLASSDACETMLFKAWVYGDFDEQPDFQFRVLSIIGIQEIDVKTVIYENESIEGAVTVINGESGRELKISLYNAITGSLISTISASLSTTPSETIPFDFGQHELGNYKIVAEITSEPCNPCGIEKTVSVLKATLFPVAEMDAISVLAVIANVLFIILISKKSN